ncbi:uncharacterized protein LOC106469610 isoform X2 [Limulus polyphemus]|uniref:Uncharacterized protein LOC106469610 isoform X2 n=1 Tax=Limulus polyphemus TaxID=6850 RepID=A0ABM1TDD8_LIMPO|nr:uncharacterized protein LOC106469610 isoform X2 [Limulus polyphemus]
MGNIICQAQTVGFLDTPKHLNRHKQQTRKIQLYTNNWKKVWNENENSTAECSIVYQPKQASGLQVAPNSTSEEFSLAEENYYEDNIMTGHLGSTTDEDRENPTDEELFDSDSLFSCMENLSFSQSNSVLSSSNMLFSCNKSNSYLCVSSTPLHKEQVQRVNGSLQQTESSDCPDVLLLEKLKTCFDEERIKDIYVLSGRIQDILNPEEIEEVLAHCGVYSEYIDDELLEAFSFAHSELNSFNENEKIKCHSENKGYKSQKKKTIHADKSQIIDVKNDIRIRAIFEGYRKREKGKQKVNCTLIDKTKRKDKYVCFSPSTYAFFEESFNNSSTLRKILPELETTFPSDANTLYNQPTAGNRVFKNSSAYNCSKINQNISIKKKDNSDRSVEMEELSQSIKSTSNKDLRDFENSSRNACIENECVSPEENSEKTNRYNSVRIENNKSEYVLETAHLGTNRLVLEHTEAEEHIRNSNYLSNTDTHQKPESSPCLTTGEKNKIQVYPDTLESDTKSVDQMVFLPSNNRNNVDIMSNADDLVTSNDTDFPDDLDDSFTKRLSGELIPELTAAEEIANERNWRTFIFGGLERKIDVKVIEPYRKVLSHGGYYGPNRNAIVIFSACYLPDRSQCDYDYIMDNLFLYLLKTVEELVADDYVLVYLHDSSRRSNILNLKWLKQCYQAMDRRMRKNLKGLYIVHPTFWVRTIFIMTRPLISTKFMQKLHFMNSLQDLLDIIFIDDMLIPGEVKQQEFQNMIQEKKNLKKKSGIWCKLFC